MLLEMLIRLGFVYFLLIIINGEIFSTNLGDLYCEKTEDPDECEPGYTIAANITHIPSIAKSSQAHVCCCPTDDIPDPFDGPTATPIGDCVYHVCYEKVHLPKVCGHTSCCAVDDLCGRRLNDVRLHCIAYISVPCIN
eukprot:Platyproteum_vivax@DN5983_c0_g1_i3.p1